MQCATHSVWLSLDVLAWSLGLQLSLGVALGWVLARTQFFGKTLLESLVSLPLIFPPIVIGYGLLLLLGQQGWVTQWLPPPLRPSVVFTHTGLVLAAFVAGLPLMVKPVQSAFMSVPDTLREAAAGLGAPPWAVFRDIDWPLARRGIAVGLILSGGRALGEVGISLMLGGNIAGRTETLSLAIYNHVLSSELACANQLSLMLAGCAVLAFYALKRYGAL